MRKSLPLILSLLLLPLLLLKFAPIAHAQTVPKPFDLSISPSVVEFTIKPGKTVTQAFLIENTGSIDLTITPTLRDFTANGESGLPKLESGSTFPYANLANSKIKLNQPFILAAGKSDQIVLEISPTEAAETRDWYFTVLLQAQPNLDNTVFAGQNTISGATGYIGGNVLVKVTQTGVEPLHWQVQLNLPTFIDSLQKINFIPTVSNQSDTVATPDMTITILKGSEILSTQEALPDRILAKSSRVIYAKEARKDDPRSFEGVPFQFSQLFAVGKYTIRTTIRNNQGGPLVVEQTVWALPVSIAIGILASIGIVTSIIVLRRRQQRPEKSVEK